MENLLSTYFVQPDCIPDEISRLVAQQLPDEKILAYTYVDLDGKRRYDSRWLIATQHHLVKASLPPGGPAVWELKVTLYSAIQSIEILEGVSSDRLFVTGVDKMLLDEIFYTRRQSRAAGQVKFVAEQRIKLVREPGKAAHALSENLDAHRDYREGILQAVNDAKALLVMPKMGVIARLLSYLKPYKGRMAVALGFAMLFTLIQLLPPWLTRVAIDNVMRPLEKGANPSAGKLLWLIIGSLAVIWMLGEVLQFVRLRVMALVGEKVARDLRSGIYAHMQKLSLSFFSQRQTGSLITRVSSDSDRLWDFVTFGILDIITAVLQIIGVAVALFLQDRSLAFLVIMPLPFMGLMFYYHGKNMQGLFTRIWRKWSAMTAVLSDVIPGMRVVKAFAQEDHEVDRFERRNRAVEQEASQLHREWTRFWPTVMVLMHTCSLIVWVVGAPRVMQHMLSGGKEGMPLGVFIAFTGYMWMFWGPVQQLGMMSRMINRVTTSAARIFEVLDTVPTVVTNDHPVALERIEGKITFENVVFSYDGIRNALKGVSFDVHAGEMIGLVGPSGGGKTTLVNLICRFYDVKAGRVLVDNVDVRDLDLSQLRRQVGVVLQEPYLFHGTVAENIAYGSHSAKMHDIIEAARAANAHDFICGLVDGYETVVGERGQTLSGGERQRISIARAILHNPRVLILDEATSSVDTETEKKIQEALKRLVAGRTTFAIAHRLSTLASADRLLVMEDGHLAEFGTHKELLALPQGIYAKLHRTQVEMQALIAV